MKEKVLLSTIAVLKGALLDGARIGFSCKRMTKRLAEYELKSIIARDSRGPQ